MATFTLIESVTVGPSGSATISFTSIPSTYTDLCLEVSLRNAGASIAVGLSLNGSTANFTQRLLASNGSSAFSQSASNGTIQSLAVDGTNWTANTFGNSTIYFPNYTSSSNKSFSVDSVTENNAATAYTGLTAGLWSNSAAINQIDLTAFTTFTQYSTAYLYGVSNA